MNEILFQYGPPADAQPYVVCTVPADHERIIHTLSVTNLVREDMGDQYAGVKYKIHIVKAGGTAQQENCLAYYPAYITGQSVHRYEGIRMSEGDTIVVYCFSGRIAVQGFGVNIDLLGGCMC